MILLHKNKESLFLNSHLIERIETNPDTIITLTNGNTLRVIESAEEVVQKIKEYERAIRRS